MSFTSLNSRARTCSNPSLSDEKSRVFLNHADALAVSNHVTQVECSGAKTKP